MTRSRTFTVGDRVSGPGGRSTVKKVIGDGSLVLMRDGNDSPLGVNVRQVRHLHSANDANVLQQADQGISLADVDDTEDLEETE